MESGFVEVLCSEEYADLLQSSPSLLTSRDPNGCTLLHYVCANGKLDILDYISKAYTTIFSQLFPLDNNQNSALHYASYYGHVEIVRFLLSSDVCDMSQQNLQGKTSLHLAVQNRQSSLYSLFYFHQRSLTCCLVDNNNASPLHWAVYNHDLDSVRELLRYEANLNGVTTDGYTALSLAEAEGESDIACLLNDKLVHIQDVLNDMRGKNFNPNSSLPYPITHYVDKYGRDIVLYSLHCTNKDAFLYYLDLLVEKVKQDPAPYLKEVPAMEEYHQILTDYISSNLTFVDMKTITDGLRIVDLLEDLHIVVTSPFPASIDLVNHLEAYPDFGPHISNVRDCNYFTMLMRSYFHQRNGRIQLTDSFENLDLTSCVDVFREKTIETMYQFYCMDSSVIESLGLKSGFCKDLKALHDKVRQGKISIHSISLNSFTDLLIYSNSIRFLPEMIKHNCVTFVSLLNNLNLFQMLLPYGERLEMHSYLLQLASQRSKFDYWLYSNNILSYLPQFYAQGFNTYNRLGRMDAQEFSVIGIPEDQIQLLLASLPQND